MLTDIKHEDVDFEADPLVESENNSANSELEETRYNDVDIAEKFFNNQIFDLNQQRVTQSVSFFSEAFMQLLYN